MTPQAESGNRPIVSYAITHRALVEVARLRRMAPADVWLCVAISERGGTSTTDVLQDDMRLPTGTQIRRSLLTLRPLYLTGGDKRGVRWPITLTAEGRLLVDDFLMRCAALTGERLEIAA